MRSVIAPKCQKSRGKNNWVILVYAYLSMIEHPKRDWHISFYQKGLCYRRATAETFILDLLYTRKERFSDNVFMIALLEFS